jgi:hypothetical protein
MTADELRNQLRERIRGLRAKKQETIARCDAEVAVLNARIDALKALDDIFGQVTFVDALNALDSAGQALEIKWN